LTSEVRETRNASRDRADGEIVGAVRDRDGLPVVGALVRAFSIRLRGEEPLGSDARADMEGRYCISAPLTPAAGTARLNVRVTVLDSVGRALASSAVQFGVHGSVTIDVTLREREGIRSEQESLTAAVAPLLDGVAVPDLTEADIAFLVGATGIPAADLRGLVISARHNGGATDAVPTAHEATEEVRQLRDVTIRVRETAPGRFEASFKPVDPLHIARNGYTLDTRRGLRGHTLTEALDCAEANWQQNYPET
jgi:hypothetical protein